MKSYNNLYSQIISFENLILAWQKARKGKTNKDYVIKFEEELFYNLLALHYELLYNSYQPRPLKSFVIRDPKTRKIHKSDFRDRVVHHAIVNILEPIYEPVFIFDSFANRLGKGNLKAIERLYYFIRKVSRNGKIKGKFSNNQIKGFYFKADIKHYFKEVDHEVLINVLRRKIIENQTLNLLKKIIRTSESRERERK